MRNSQFWTKIFGFSKGDLVRHKKYPKTIYTVTYIGNRKLILKVKSGLDTGVPWQITLEKWDDSFLFEQLEKVSYEKA